MSIPGLDLEAEGGDPNPPVHDADPNVLPQQPAEDEDDTDGLIETVSVGSQKMVPVSELIAYRKQAREAKRQWAEAQPLLTRAQQIEAQLTEAQPILQAIRNNPGLIDAATKGTHATPAQAEQPENDQDAKDLAEDMGFYTTAGELDMARARRILDRTEARVAKRMQAEIAPIKQQNAEASAAVMRQRVDAMRTKAGTPLASKESLDSIFGMVPVELRADPRTAFVMALAAAGMDLHSGRTPAATAAPQAAPQYGEPIYTEAPGRRAANPISAELAQLGKRVGLSEKDLQATSAKFAPGRSIELE